ncbi:MAG: heavy metal-associated domain-containing protein [Gemmatimonadaceae bacterium]
MITIVTIAGMRGEHCKRAVFTALTPVAGIRSADVSLGRVTIDHDGTVTEAELCEAISVTGYVIADVVHERRLLPIVGNQVEANPI